MLRGNAHRNARHTDRNMLMPASVPADREEIALAFGAIKAWELTLRALRKQREDTIVRIHARPTYALLDTANGVSAYSPDDRKRLIKLDMLIKNAEAQLAAVISANAPKPKPKRKPKPAPTYNGPVDIRALMRNKKGK